MIFELKRGLRNRFIILFILVNILNIILGLILLTTIDGVSVITFQNLFESVYTVFTQFGPLIFSALIISIFYIDYKEKNIFFYYKLGLSPLKYYISKLSMLMIVSCLSSCLVSLLICYNDFSCINFLIVFLKIESVIIYYIVVMSTIAFIVPNFMIAFFINFVLWIIGIIISTMGHFFKYFAYFDASNEDYKFLMKYIDNKVSFANLMIQITHNYIFVFLVFIICFIIIFLSSKRWFLNGI